MITSFYNTINTTNNLIHIIDNEKDLINEYIDDIDAKIDTMIEFTHENMRYNDTKDDKDERNLVDNYIDSLELICDHHNEKECKRFLRKDGYLSYTDFLNNENVYYISKWSKNVHKFFPELFRKQVFTFLLIISRQGYKNIMKDLIPLVIKHIRNSERVI